MRLRSILQMVECVRVLPVIILICAASVPTHAGIINVPADQPTIQAGIDAATSWLDTVIVAEGTYYENIHYKGKLLVVASHFFLDSLPQHIYNTVINGSNPTHPDTASCVRITNYEDEHAQLIGFTITGGTGTNWTDPHGFGDYREGGGILCEFSSPIIMYNLIIDNEAVEVGPGITSAGGGGIRAGDGNPHILNNIIMNNRGRYGAGIVLNFAEGEIKNNVIAYNSGGEDYSGSGIWKYDGGDGLAENNTVAGNVSTKSGAGFYIWSTSMTLINNIVWDNVGPGVKQIQLNSGSVAVSYCDVQGGYAGTGNINIDPQFIGDFLYLQSGSACIDAGNTDPTYYDPENPSSAGNALWPAQGTVSNDIGAYGGPGSFTFEPIAIFCDGTHGSVPLEVNFENASIYNADAYKWYFGDSDSSSESAPIHIYQAPGIYDVSLEIGSGGNTYTATKAAYIYALADSLTADQVEGMPGQNVDVTFSGGNLIPLKDIFIPAEFSGDLNISYVSHTTAGCRTAYFENVELLENDGVTKRLYFHLQASAGGGAPDLDAGSGALLKVTFKIESTGSTGNETPIVLAGYAPDKMPQFVSMFTYGPATTSGLVTQSAICGDANGDDLANIGDGVYLINYVFKGGPPPISDIVADCNCDGGVNVGDAVYIINYVFSGGSAPCANCP